MTPEPSAEAETQTVIDSAISNPYENVLETPLPAPPLQISVVNNDGPSSPTSPPLQSNTASNYQMYTPYPPPYLSTATQLQPTAYSLSSGPGYGMGPTSTYSTTTLPMLFPTDSSDPILNTTLTTTNPSASVVIASTPSLDATKSPQMNTHVSPTTHPTPQNHHNPLGQTISPFALSQPPTLLMSAYPGLSIDTPMMPQMQSTHLQMPISNMMPYPATTNTIPPQSSSERLDGHE